MIEWSAADEGTGFHIDTRKRKTIVQSTKFDHVPSHGSVHYRRDLALLGGRKSQGPLGGRQCPKNEYYHGGWVAADGCFQTSFIKCEYGTFPVGRLPRLVELMGTETNEEPSSKGKGKNSVQATD